MTVAFDASSDAGEFTAATDPKTWTHTPTGTPRGVLVFAQNTGTTADWINGTVSYGGQPLTRIPTDGWAVDSAIEVASIYAYFLGSGIPTGAQTVSIDHDSGIFGTKWACCVTITGDADTEVVASGRITADTANPSIALDSGARVAIKLFNLYSGQDAIASVTNPAGITRVIAAKYASEIRSRVVGYRTTPGTGSETVGQTAGNDDVAMIGVAVAEVESAEPVEGDVASSVSPSTASSGSPVIAGTSAPSVAPVASLSGTPRVTGTAASTAAPSTAASGSTTVTGTAAASVAPSTAASAATTVTGAAAATVTPSTAVSGSPVASGTMATSVAPSAAATGTPVVTGTAASAVTPSTALLGEAQTVTGTMASSVVPQAAASGAPRVTGAVSSSVAAVASATGSGIVTGSVAVAIPMAMTAALGSAVATGAVASSVVPITAMTGAPPFDWEHATGTVTLSTIPAATVTLSDPAAASVSISSAGSGVVTA